MEGEKAENPEKNSWTKDDNLNQQQTRPPYVTKELKELNLSTQLSFLG